MCIKFITGSPISAKKNIPAPDIFVLDCYGQKTFIIVVLIVYLDGDFSSSDDNDEEEDGFLSLLIDKLLELHEAKDKAVR